MSSLKKRRECSFPLECLLSAVQFQCSEGEASKDADKAMILSEIGDQRKVSDDTVHGVVAASGLLHVLEAGRYTSQVSAQSAEMQADLRETFFSALRDGKVCPSARARTCVPSTSL
jgi:hypothetical protein